MAIIELITTTGAANADSYGSVDEFDVYLSRRRGSATVATMTSDEKSQGLLEAMTFLAPLKWRGERTTTAQALAHPRIFLPKPYSGTAEGVYGELIRYGASELYYASDAIAQPVKDAQCELAFLILNGQFNADEGEGAAVISSSSDGLAETYANGGKTLAQQGKLPLSVGRILSGLCRGAEFKLA